MKNTISQFAIFFISSLSLNLFGQTHFEKGYVIDQGNRKADCLLYDKDWKFNP